MKVTVIGVVKGKNKAGREFSRLYVTSEFSDYEVENNGAVGLKCMEVFTYIDCSFLRVNDVVDLVYEPGFQGRADLTDIIPVKAPDSKTAAAK